MFFGTKSGFFWREMELSRQLMWRATGLFGAIIEFSALAQIIIRQRDTMSATATAPAKAKKKRAVSLPRNDPHVAQQQHARLPRQQATDACAEYWNEVLAAEGSFAEDRSALSNAREGEK
jgi:hypothetical protein